jgi:hypothetical protein
MALPTFSLRVAPEHQPLVRDIAAALRIRPDLADVLSNALQAEPLPADGMTLRDTDVLQPILDRLTAVEQRLAMIERTPPFRHKETTAASRPDPADPREPQRAFSTRRRPVVMTDDLRRQIYDLRAQGWRYDDIAEHLGVGIGTVGRVLDKPRPAD